MSDEQKPALNTSPSDGVFSAQEDLTTTGQETSAVLSHVHSTPEEATAFEMTPPHPPRVESPAYKKSHNHLIHELDTPCLVCGVKQSTLNTPDNRYGATQLETHHYPIERSLMDACDPAKVSRFFSQVTDQASLEQFVDSEANLIVLCDEHHRGKAGIHHLLAQEWAIQPFIYDGYQVVADSASKDAVAALDDAIEKEHGHE